MAMWKLEVLPQEIELEINEERTENGCLHGTVVSYKVETEEGVQRRHGNKKSESVQTEATAAATIERGYRHRRSLRRSRRRLP